VKNEKPQIKV